MQKKTSINRKLNKLLISLLLGSLPLVIGFNYFLLKANAEREILKQADLLASTMEATRNYVVKYTTPILEREVPGKFIVQGMADSFVNDVIFSTIEKDHPNYSYKNAALNPLNLKNKADIFEEQKINEFNDDLIKDEWRGFMDKPTGKVYSVMRPVRVRDMSCLSCHGDPDLAPDEIVDVYGKEHGYHWEVGDVVAVDAIYIPADIPIKNALTALGFLTIIYIAFVIIFVLIINRYLSKTVVEPIKNFTHVADKISIGDFNQELDATGNDELQDLATAITRLRASILKMLKMLKR